MDERLRPFERLRKKEEIRNVLQRKGYQGIYCTLYLRPNRENHSRLGLIVSRKVGNAVVRNRVKRLYREAFRHLKCNLNTKVDIVIRAKPSAAAASYHSIFDDLAHLLKDKLLE